MRLRILTSHKKDMALNTTKIGTEFENRVFKFFSSLLDEDKIAGASKKHSKIQKHQKFIMNIMQFGKVEFSYHYRV